MYNYETQKKELFTDEGQRVFLKIRDRADTLLKESGAFRAQELMTGVSGDTWTHLACIDRLIELQEIREITNGSYTAAQLRIFTHAI